MPSRHALATLFFISSGFAPVVGSPASAAVTRPGQATVAYTSLTPPLRRLVSASRCQAGGRPCPVHATGPHDGHAPHVELARAPDASSIQAPGASRDTGDRTWHAVRQVPSAMGHTFHKLAIHVGTAVGVVARMLVPSKQSLMLSALQLATPCVLAHSRVASTLGLLVLRCAGRIRCFLDERGGAKQLATDGSEKLPSQQRSVWSNGLKVCKVLPK